MCEMWWEKGLEGKEQLGKTVFIMLLRKSLNKAATVCEDILNFKLLVNILRKNLSTIHFFQFIFTVLVLPS